MERWVLRCYFFFAPSVFHELLREVNIKLFVTLQMCRIQMLFISLL